VKELRALGLLTGLLSPAERESVEAALQHLPAMQKRQLSEREHETLANIETIRGDFGALLPNDEYAKIIQEALDAPFDMLWVPKHYIETRWFRNAGRLSIRWSLYPPHTRFGVDAKWVIRNNTHTREWRLMEATLFEDLALLWNKVVDSQAGVPGAVGDQRIPEKESNILKRSAVRAAFALLEGYLNGIAHDIVITRDLPKMSVAARELLRERDEEGRPKFKPLRAKLLGYPRLALDRDSPLMDENTCAEMAYVLQKERELRDAVMHPSPRVDADRTVLREQSFYEVELGVVDGIVTNTIGLIRRIDAAIDGVFGRVELWLHDRREDRKFPPETFY
jgi:hypothetical protein